MLGFPVLEKNNVLLKKVPQLIYCKSKSIKAIAPSGSSESILLFDMSSYNSFTVTIGNGTGGAIEIKGSNDLFAWENVLLNDLRLNTTITSNRIVVGPERNYSHNKVFNFYRIQIAVPPTSDILIEVVMNHFYFEKNTNVNQNEDKWNYYSPTIGISAQETEIKGASAPYNRYAINWLRVVNAGTEGTIFSIKSSTTVIIQSYIKAGGEFEIPWGMILAENIGIFPLIFRIENTNNVTIHLSVKGYVVKAD